MKKIWWEDRISSLSSFCNLSTEFNVIIPEVLKFIEANKSLFEEWVLDQWVDDRNLGRVQLWEGAWRVIPFPINCVGTTATDKDFELSEMVSFTKLFNTTTERVQEELPRIRKVFEETCPNTRAFLQDDIDGKILKSATISKLSPGTKINPHQGDVDSLRIHFPVVTDPGAWLSVRGRKRTWEIGEVFAFKDHNKHWAQHNGTHDRIIVILDYSIEQLIKYGIDLTDPDDEFEIDFD